MCCRRVAGSMDDSLQLPISLLSQYMYCSRRAGLLLLEQSWEDNEYTAAGMVSHQRTHDARIEKRGELVKLYGFAVQSERLNISGVCDCVEASAENNGAEIPELPGRYLLYPLEYKHGVVRDETEYNVQLCAQAMCLEEMFGIGIPLGAIFYIDAHRRSEVALDGALREKVEDSVSALRFMLATLKVPPAKKTAKCRKCSIANPCMPDVRSSAALYMKMARQAALGQANETSFE